MSKLYLVGFFHVDGFGSDSVETPLTGNSHKQYARLEAAISERHPGKKANRFGSRIESRDKDNPGWIELFPGMTLHQMFEDQDGNSEPVRKVGTVFFSSSPFEIALLLNRSVGGVKVRLLPLLRTDGVVTFSNVINAQLPAADVSRLIAEVLGSDARDIKLNIRDKNPKL